MCAAKGAACSSPAMAAPTRAGVAWAMGFWPTTATGAWAQRPTQGAAMTRMPSRAASAFCSSLDPAMAQGSDWQMRTVKRGGPSSPSRTRSKCW